MVNSQTKIDINTASKEQLEAATGIDGELADHIIEFRRTRRIRSEDDLKQVPGFEDIRARQILQVVSIGKEQESRAEPGRNKEPQQSAQGSNRSSREDPAKRQGSSKPDINTASKEQLEQALGIDGELAAHIIEYRENHGPIESREDLMKVPGFEKVRSEQVLEAVGLP